MQKVVWMLLAVNTAIHPVKPKALLAVLPVALVIVHTEVLPLLR
jgi:hypothetical protein